MPSDGTNPGVPHPAPIVVVSDTCQFWERASRAFESLRETLRGPNLPLRCAPLVFFFFSVLDTYLGSNKEPLVLQGGRTPSSDPLRFFPNNPPPVFEGGGRNFLEAVGNVTFGASRPRSEWIRLRGKDVMSPRSHADIIRPLIMVDDNLHSIPFYYRSRLFSATR